MRSLHPLPDPLGDDFLTYYLPLTRGYFAKVDWKDRVRIRSLRWRAMPQPNGIVYVGGTVMEPNGSCRDVLLHRWLMGEPAELMVDHVNHDGLDNRLSNLRLATRGQNGANRRRGGKQRNKHGYRGVRAAGGAYHASITCDGRRYASGRCATPEEAARAWDELAVWHYGRFIELNFPAFPDPISTLSEDPDAIAHANDEAIRRGEVPTLAPHRHTVPEAA